MRRAGDRVISGAAASVFSRCAIFVRASGRLPEKEWGIVKGYLIRWARTAPPYVPFESEGGPIPHRLALKLARRQPFQDVPKCPDCGRRVLVPNSSEEVT